MSREEGFLARWARLKREAVQAAPARPVPDPGAALPEPLPPLESLDFASDFSAFLQDRVEETVKRAALKKLFHSPEFNVMDGLDVYIDDYGAPDPIPPEMLEGLAHAQEMLFGRDARAPAQEEASQEQTESAGARHPVAGSEDVEAARPALPPASGD